MAHPWERYGSSSDLPWERDTYGQDEDSDEDPSEEEIAAASFLDALLEQYLLSQISAKTFCVLCHFAALAGLPSDDVRRRGKGPGYKSGANQRLC